MAKKIKNKLELKHLAPYLPYELEVKVINDRKVLALNNSTLNISLDRVLKSDYCFPILRPLSEYKKYPDIIEQFSDYSLEQFEIAFFSFVNCLNKLDKVNYTIMELMFKHHLDIFDLISKGLAVDINTIKK